MYFSLSVDETNLPADIPSYLSSQGTLADRQDGYVPSESSSNHQFMAPSVGGFYMQPKDMNGKTHIVYLKTICHTRSVLEK